MHAARLALLPTLLLAACGSAPQATPTVPIETVTEAALEVVAQATNTSAPLATFAPVNAEIAVGNASCRVGPGGAYLLRSVLHEGDAVEIRGQMELNENWVLISTAAFPAGCWINTDLLDFAEAEFNIISNPHIVLPSTSYYSPLRGVTATRSGDVVRVRWDPLVLREGDDSLQTAYVVEAWVCQNGEFVFRAYGTNEYAVRIIDEEGCTETSRAQVAGAEISGYTDWVTVQWP